MIANKRLEVEVFFLIGPDEAVLWSDASDSPTRLPDSRSRWEAIWARRARLVEIAHSHPLGPLGFSQEDESTMEALIAALGPAFGEQVRFSVVAPRGMIARQGGRDERVFPEPWWASLLRRASAMGRARGMAPARRKEP